jgi:hypothetical protein
MSADSKKLLRVYRDLSAPRQAALLEYAGFLASRDAADGLNQVPQEPLGIPRPEQESVIKAIQRLMASYPMLDRNKLLNDTSAQMTRHVIHGISAVEVIDELEVIFRRHYELHVSEKAEPDQAASEL